MDPPLHLFWRLMNICAIHGCNVVQDADDTLPAAFRDLAQKDSAWEGSGTASSHHQSLTLRWLVAPILSSLPVPPNQLVSPAKQMLRIVECQLAIPCVYTLLNKWGPHGKFCAWFFQRNKDCWLRVRAAEMAPWENMSCGSVCLAHWGWSFRRRLPRKPQILWGYHCENRLMIFHASTLPLAN